MVTLEIIQIGDSHGGARGSGALCHVSFREGDTVYVTRTRDGAWQLSPYGAAIAEEIAIGERIMEEYAETFRALART